MQGLPCGHGLIVTRRTATGKGPDGELRSRQASYARWHQRSPNPGHFGGFCRLEYVSLQGRNNDPRETGCMGRGIARG
eukprot:5959248-Pleurochrysis_carterae.AAC.2